MTLTTGINKYKTIIMSDIHLGMIDSKALEVVDFLKNNSCDTLILNGDIIDVWALKRGAKWKEKHMTCVKKIISLSTKGTKVFWIRGNHDDIIKNFFPMSFGKIKMREELEIESNGKKFLVLHGDVFDVFITKMGWLSKIGSVAYDFALFLNRWYNKYRSFRDKNYLSISKKMKENVKFATNFVNKFEHHLVDLARRKNYDGVICGHIHVPIIKEIEEIIYMNSGDYIENLSCLVETHEGEWSLVYYQEDLEKRKEIL